MTAIADLSIADLLRAYRRRELSPTEVLADVLARLDAAEPQINAVTYQDRQGSEKEAKESESRWLRGEPKGELDGVPVSLKSNIYKKGWPSRRGSHQMPDVPDPFDAPAVVGLESAGAIIFAQTTMPEFGWKGIGDSPLTGITRNPWKLGHTTGGSSAGAAALGALGIGWAHVGTDGLGSIRIPSSFTGLFGLKPSFGRVPAYPASPFGMVAHLGPMARSVEDAAFMLNALSRPDDRDMRAWNDAPPDFRIGLQDGVKGLRIGFSPALGYVENIAADIASSVRDAAETFRSLGARVELADPGFSFADARTAADIMWQAGAASILKGIPAEKHAEIDPGFVKAAVIGQRLSAIDFVGAMATAARITETMRQYFERYDLLLTPTMPVTALPVGRDVHDDGSWGEDWVNWSPLTYPFNLTGQPAASVPCGLSSDGLPVGLQIVGPRRADALVMRASRALESVAPFARLDRARS